MSRMSVLLAGCLVFTGVLLGQAPGQPRPRYNVLFIAAGFYRPHVPCVATPKYFDFHPLNATTLPTEPHGHVDKVPPIALATKPSNYGLGEEPLRTFVRSYLASVRSPINNRCATAHPRSSV